MSISTIENINIGEFTNYISRFEDNKFLSSFFLKEKNEVIKIIENNPIVEMKDISFYSNGQAALLLLFRFSNKDKYIYGRWFNYSNKVDCELLQMLLFQEELPLSIIDQDNNIKFTAWVCNDFKEAIKCHIRKCRGISMNDNEFSSYVASLENNYKYISELWSKSIIYK